MPEPLRVAVLSPQAIVAEGLRALFSLAAGRAEILEAIESAVTGWRVGDAGDSPVVGSEDSATGKELVGGSRGLSRRETQVLGLVGQGWSNSEIAADLYLSPNTVKTYIRSAYRKIGAANRSQAATWAVTHGLAGLSRSWSAPGRVSRRPRRATPSGAGDRAVARASLDPTGDPAPGGVMSEISERYDYVVVGAGMAAASAASGIRTVDADGSIALLGAEADPPLYRPDLSKTLWLKDDATPEDSRLVDEGTDVDLRTGVEVTGISPADHTISLADGGTVRYGKLLLATGAEPRTAGLPAGPRVVYYRTLADYRRLRDLARPGTHVAVVGGGYIGSEIAAALSQNDVRVTLVLGGALVQETMFPEGLARHVTDAFTAHGVEIVHGMLAGGEAGDDGVTLRLEDGTTISADAAVVGVGVTPRTRLAEQAGLAVENGIVVDERLRTSAEDVYAAGDVASYPDVRLGRRRVEHADNAEKMGELAGRVMAGEDTTYDRTPFFWSDLYDDGYEAIGELSTRHAVVEDWADDDHGAGVVYYLDGGAVRGVLLWNVWDSVPSARALIEATGAEPVADPQSLRGRIPLG